MFSQKQKREIKQRIRAASSSSDTIGGPSFLDDRATRSQINEDHPNLESHPPPQPARQPHPEPVQSAITAAAQATRQVEEPVKPKAVSY